MIDTEAIRAKILELITSQEQWPTETLESIIRTIPSKPYQVLESEVTEKGKYRVISQSKEFSIGYSEDVTKLYHHDQPVIVFGDHTTVIKYIDFDFIVGADGVKILEPNYNIVHPKYLYYMILHHLMDFIESGGYARHYRYVKKFQIPIPPLTEQRNIAEKVESCFSILDTIDTLQSQYQDNLATLKSKIIDAGIQGKLTQQLPEDGTAEELYQQIQQEKLALEKAGKIKKSKPLPPISDEEKPFDIPDNWKWVRLEEITKKITSGNTPPGGKKSDVYVDKGFCFFREQNIYNDGIHHAGMVYISEQLLNTRENSTVIAKDILLNITGGSIGRCAIVPDGFTRGSINQHILIIRMVNEVMRFYIHSVMCSNYAQQYIKKKAVGDKDGFSGGRCKSMPIPLPPLAEQKRIVAKLEELLPLCEG